VILLLEKRGAKVTYSDPFVPVLTLDGRQLMAEDLLPAARAVARAAGGPASFTPAARTFLLSHPWRGNFRELENVVRRAASSAAVRGGAIDAADLRLAEPSDPEGLLAAASHAGWTLRELADAYIKMVLDDAGGNVAEAARRLGIARKTLYGRRS